MSQIKILNFLEFRVRGKKIRTLSLSAVPFLTKTPAHLCRKRKYALGSRATCRGSPGKAGGRFLRRDVPAPGYVHLWSPRSSPARLQARLSGNLNIPREVPRRFHILHAFFEQKILDKIISQAPLFLSSLTPSSASIKTCCLSTLSTLCLLFLLSIFLSLKASRITACWSLARYPDGTCVPH